MRSLQGVLWLIESTLLQNTPEQVAAFFFNETGLSKRAIGDYLGEKYVRCRRCR
jgi:Sec7-like guanine-nucleotide exchange factor